MAAILGKVLQIAGNNIKDASNKMKTDGTGSVGPEFRPVPGGIPSQTTKQSGQTGIMNEAANGIGQSGAGEAAGGIGQSGVKEAVGGIASFFSDERIKEPTESGDLLAEVAENIRNYTYHYKPGVGEDPSVEYSGPMAQELLQVDGYRSCVIQGSDGLLKVDTSRLALTNAGMIADLSKRLLFMENLIKAVMAGLQQPQEQPVPEQTPVPDVE